jgi:hypothetical protein
MLKLHPEREMSCLAMACYYLAIVVHASVDKAPVNDQPETRDQIGYNFGSVPLTGSICRPIKDSIWETNGSFVGHSYFYLGMCMSDRWKCSMYLYDSSSCCTLCWPQNHKLTTQVGLNGNASDLNSGGVWFEPQLGHQLI